MALTDTIATREYFSNRGSTNSETFVAVVTHSIDDTRAFVIPREGFGLTNFDTKTTTVELVMSGTSGFQTMDRVSINPGEKWTIPGDLGVFPGENLYVALSGSIETSQSSWNVVYFQVAD